MDETHFDRLARDLAGSLNRRRAPRGVAGIGVALLAISGTGNATFSKKKKKSKIQKIACRIYTETNYPECIEGSTALCQGKAMWENWDLADCLARYVPCCEFFKNCHGGGEQAAECQYQYVLSIRTA